MYITWESMTAVWYMGLWDAALPLVFQGNEAYMSTWSWIAQSLPWIGVGSEATLRDSQDIVSGGYLTGRA